MLSSILICVVSLAIQDDQPDLTYLNDWRFDEVITNPGFQRELDLTIEQKKDLRAAESSLRREMVRKNTEIAAEGGKPKVHLMHKEFVGQLSERVAQILLPGQLKRAKEVLLWRQLNQGGIETLVEFGPVVRELELSPEMKAQLKDKRQKLTKEYEAKVKELQLKYRQKAFRILGEENAARLKKLGGEPSLIEMPKPKF